ncbi:hypothetical protein D9611_008791 [Ephemerocybe angulata]|uniref:Uncharacterized protein n=1 Tax=Ephemerocybe angulata TaxID=980116 RepID=A0A8H5CBQ8_9AGAR|nr:hypothetical protein D9611_008791 [Tulosesus angulatus]
MHVKPISTTPDEFVFARASKFAKEALKQAGQKTWTDGAMKVVDAVLSDDSKSTEETKASTSSSNDWREKMKQDIGDATKKPGEAKPDMKQGNWKAEIDASHEPSQPPPPTGLDSTPAPAPVALSDVKLPPGWKIMAGAQTLPSWQPANFANPVVAPNIGPQAGGSSAAPVNPTPPNSSASHSSPAPNTSGSPTSSAPGGPSPASPQNAAPSQSVVSNRSVPKRAIASQKKAPGPSPKPLPKAGVSIKPPTAKKISKTNLQKKTAATTKKGKLGQPIAPKKPHRVVAKKALASKRTAAPKAASLKRGPAAKTSASKGTRNSPVAKRVPGVKKAPVSKAAPSSKPAKSIRGSKRAPQAATGKASTSTTKKPGVPKRPTTQKKPGSTTKRAPPAALKKVPTKPSPASRKAAAPIPRKASAVLTNTRAPAKKAVKPANTPQRVPALQKPPTARQPAAKKAPVPSKAGKK